MKVANVRFEKDSLVAFYEFENGDVETKRFPLDSDFKAVQAFGEERVIARKRLQVEREELETLAKADPVVVEEIITAEVAKSRSLEELIAEKVAVKIETEVSLGSLRK